MVVFRRKFYFKQTGYYKGQDKSKVRKIECDI